MTSASREGAQAGEEDAALQSDQVLDGRGRPPDGPRQQSGFVARGNVSPGGIHHGHGVAPAPQGRHHLRGGGDRDIALGAGPAGQHGDFHGPEVRGSLRPGRGGGTGSAG
jgi:hypothetical protein